MNSWLVTFLHAAAGTARDVLPIVAVLLAFQLWVLKRPVPNPRRRP